MPTTVVPTTSFPLHFERMSSNDPAHPANVKLVPTTLPLSPRVKKFYHFQFAWFLPKIKLSFDRLALLAMLDRNVTALENVASIFLAIGESKFHHYMVIVLVSIIW